MMRRIRANTRLTTPRKLHTFRATPRSNAPEPPVQRPEPSRLTSLAHADNVKRLLLPHGCFNAGLAPFQGGYICVYRPSEYAFHAAFLSHDLTVITSVDLGITNCADPRLLWLPDGRLLMVYSSYDDGSFHNECIRGAILLDRNGTNELQTPVQPFRISPPGTTRQKNWMPFLYQDRVHLIASTKPHIIYELPEIGELAHQVFETDFVSPWFNHEFKRGNTTPVLLPDGNFLGTFHTVQRHGYMHYYDNGCYVFEGKPPFRVLRCGNRTYLPAEAAREPHFRKKGQIMVCFPVGMICEQDKLLISYGDNDSSVKILTTTVPEMLATTLGVY